MKYMTFGLYGSSWTVPSGKTQKRQDISEVVSEDTSNDIGPTQARVQSLQNLEPKPVDSSKRRDLLHDVSKGCFLIGLKGDLENEGETDDDDHTVETGTDRDRDTETKSWNSRILLRTLQVERRRGSSNHVDDDIVDC